MHFVIAGSITCPQFTYAVMVAQRLKENLPDFTYLKMAMKPDEYKNWLIGICKENQWYHIHSPIIWREIGLRKGKKDFIGDINKFLDLCYDYYGIPQDILSAEQFNKEEIDWFTKRTESEYFENVKVDARHRRGYRSRQVCITGAASQLTEIIIMEILQIKSQRRENGLEIRLFDDPTKEKRLSGASMDAKCCPGPSGFGNCRVANTLKEALFNVDLVIVLDSFTRKTNETLVKWLKRNRNAMCALGKALNKYAPAHCRVILGGPNTQPLCYNATVLASFATKLHVRNIVAVTQDLGRQMLKLLSTKTKVPIRDFYCPPVWGFVGLNKYVDVRKTLQTFLYKVPGKRFKSTLPQGREEYDLRTCESLLDEIQEGELHKTVAGQRAEIFPQLGRWPCLAKATAIVDLLKVWGLKQEDGNGEILCLGVYSDGTFNIPQGIYWSQPVILINGFWVPFPEYPIPRPTHFDFGNLFMFSVASLYRTKVKPRIYIAPKKKTKIKEIKKFDFSKLAETIGMPVIRTDPECVSYLKYLTKTELGIDLDLLKDYIEEEDEEEAIVKPEIAPPEEVIKKQIYCECWRQELKQLQKIVFDHSSTTEVEVDLSENLSGSEWSVINLPSKTQTDVPSSKVGDSHKAHKIKHSKQPDGVGQMTEKKSSEDSESTSTVSAVCSCGVLSTGSVCKCLGKTGSPEEQKTEKESLEGEKVSTEHFYKEQNAEIFEEDLKDAIYEDTFLGEKHPNFPSDVKQEDGAGFELKFYGTKDAAKDAAAHVKMLKRISRYEHQGEASSDEEQKSVAGETEAGSIQTKKYSEEFEAGEAEESVKEAPSTESRKESSLMFEGESALTFQPAFPFDSGKSESSPAPAEDQYSISSSYDLSYAGLPEIPGEKTVKTIEEYSAKSIEDDLFAMWGESSPYDLFDKDDIEMTRQKRKKRSGIPLCCLCRCLIPEGLTVCPCGETTVVEVFKKESMEVFIQNEDEIDYMVEYYEKEATVSFGEGLAPNENMRASKGGVQKEYEYDEDEEFAGVPLEVKRKMAALPPESFFPFSPKPSNVFLEPKRPYELTKEYIDSFEKKETEIPSKCAELLNLAKRELEESSVVGEEGEEYDYDYAETEEEPEQVEEPSLCDELPQIKTDFSDLKMFVPCGLEDWRVTVQKKYKEWFFQGPKIKDENYYDIAIEDISDDEFELDKELEKYFES